MRTESSPPLVFPALAYLVPSSETKKKVFIKFPPGAVNAFVADETHRLWSGASAVKRVQFRSHPVPLRVAGSLVADAERQPRRARLLAPRSAENRLEERRRSRRTSSVGSLLSGSARKEKVGPVGGVRVHVEDVGRGVIGVGVV